jgi:CRP/FNR family transcriptional regulator, cyclic AMP receptor protein
MLKLARPRRKAESPNLGEPAPATPIRSFGRQAGVPMSKQRAQKPFDPSTFMAAFDGGVTVSAYSEGQNVFSQGDPADAVFYIQNGKVKLSVISAQGKEAVVAFLEAGDFCGEGCLAGQLTRMATAVAATDCTIVRVAKPSMIKALHERVEFSEMFMAHLLARNIRVEADLVDQLFNSSEKRLARVLLLLANFGKDGKPEPVLAKISQETLAEMVGTTRSRVSFFMNRFRKLGFIDYNGDLKVHSSLLNVVLYDKPELRREQN